MKKVGSIPAIPKSNLLVATNRPTPKISDKAREIMKKQDEAKREMWARIDGGIPFPSIRSLR